MTTGMATASTSPTVALLTAAGFAAAGIAYWSSASNTTAFGTIVLEILRATGTLEDREIRDQNSNSNDTSNNEDISSEGKRKRDDLDIAFLSWMEREDNENNSSGRGSNRKAKKKQNLTDSQWMTERVRTFLLSINRAGAVTGATTAPTARKDDSSIVLTSSSATNERIQELKLSPTFAPVNELEESLAEKSFLRSFKTVQKATEEMMKKQPSIREDFFNGVVVDEEGDQLEEKKMEKVQSLSLSSSSSSWSAMSSSTGSYDLNKYDYLVEEEEEVERLLTYLRFVELARGETSSSSSGSPKNYLGQTNDYLQRRGERTIPDADGYVHLRFATMEIQGATDTQRAKVGYMAAVHRYRKELVVAVHYDEPPLSSSTDDECDRIKTILSSNLFMQQQGRSALGSTTTPSNPFLLLDQAVKSLYEEIRSAYLHTSADEENEESSSFLSSGYTLVLCGHSLGAALACRLGNEITQRNRDAVSEAIKVRVYAFGPPPCLPSQEKVFRDDSNKGNDYSYIVSVVNNHDSIPRWTESNLLGLQMSMRWTMDRKKYHFQRYYNRYNRSRQSASPSTTSKSAVVRRPPPRIPPFSVSSRHWNAFWKSNQQPNNEIFAEVDVHEAGPEFIVPGKVVLVWNHSKDPTIIGAKVHVPGAKHRHLGGSKGNPKNHGVLGRLWVDKSMFSDHAIASYRSNLELLLGQVGNTIF